MILDTVTRHCCETAKAIGLPSKVLPGVSVESILSELQMDTSRGLQIIVAQVSLLHRTALNREMATIVLQPGYFDTLLWRGLEHPHRVNFGPLQDCLCGQLGERRDAILIRLGCLAGEKLFVNFSSSNFQH